MITYPLIFGVSADSTSGIQTPWSASADAVDGTIPVAIPPEFEGPGGGFSPEDLYATALANCFVATFKVFAEKSRLEYRTIRAGAKLAVDRDEQGKPWMARVDISIHLDGAAREDQARRLLERTSQSCMILNSVKTEKTFEFHVTV